MSYIRSMSETTSQERCADAKAAYDEAWHTFCAYVNRPDHDIRSAEYAELERAYLAAQAAYDGACREAVGEEWP